MKDYIEERVLELARYILETNSTVRAAAKKFRVSKSTVHKDITERLLEINPGLAHEVKTVLVIIRRSAISGAVLPHSRNIKAARKRKIKVQFDQYQLIAALFFSVFNFTSMRFFPFFFASYNIRSDDFKIP